MEGSSVGLRRVVKTILTKEDMEAVVETFLEFDEFAFDTETKGIKDDEGKDVEGSGLNPLLNSVTWISMAGPGVAVAIPLAHEHGEIDVPAHNEKYRVPDPKGGFYKTGPRKGEARTITRSRKVGATYLPPPKQLTPGYVFNALEPLFFSERRKIGHNLSFDLKTISKYYDDETIPGPYGETTSLHHLLNENRGNYRLGDLSKALLGARYDKIGSKSPHLYPYSEAAAYAIKDAKYTWILWTQWQEYIEQQRLSGVLRMEMDLLPGLMEMENEGVIIDQEAMAGLEKELVKQKTEIQFDVWSDAKKRINLDANTDKAWYIYEHRGHEPEFFTAKKKEPSTRAEHLERYAKKDEMVAKLIDYANVMKTLSTYVEGMQPHLAVDGRLHATFVPYGTVTGRFSCREPNLQNIPRISDDPSNRGRMIRQLFVAPEGCSFVAADYDQIEMRVLAYYSQDPTLLNIFENDLDPHAATAAQVLRKSIEDVTKDERQAAKTTNFLIMYGGGPQRLASQAKMGIRKAERFIDDYWKQFPKVRQFADRTVRDARAKSLPYTTTILGRRRRLPMLRSVDNGLRRKAERQAVNAKVQGTAAELIKVAMIRHDHLTKGTDHKLVLTVHDELIAVSPDDQIEEGKVLLEEAMLGVDFLRNVPLRASAVAAKRWADCK
jgi:DNA polymerase I-like protein with 3'-5' exonuclease and polymerase domains